MCFWPSVCFLWRNVSLAPLPIFYWVVCSFGFCIVCKYFFPIHFVYDFFCYSKAFEFNYIPLFIFVFIFITLGGGPKRYFCNLYQTVFCSNSYVFNYFGFILVHGIKKSSNFIIWHVAVWFSQHHLLKRWSFFLVYSCLLCHRLGDHRYMSLSLDFLSCSIIYISAFVPVLYYFSDFSFVIESEIRESDSFSSSFLSQDYFGYSESFVFPYKL